MRLPLGLIIDDLPSAVLYVPVALLASESSKMSEVFFVPCAHSCGEIQVSLSVMKTFSMIHPLAFSSNANFASAEAEIASFSAFANFPAVAHLIQDEGSHTRFSSLSVS